MMPESVCQTVERARCKLDDALRRLAPRLGNRKAAIGWLAARLGTGPAALETLLYHRRASRRLMARIERAWCAALLDMLRRDLEALEHELGVAVADDVAGANDLAGLAREARDAVAALEAALAALAAEDGG